ncbi:carbon-nitrogen hydrolase family protein [Sporichthya brevicatena]|uniref:Carbon-nitrogen hydrolase family protein n=1 Tax=Sporichthya brevicatena TaxID=171442 RepID=A0ABN1G7E4_9ACTN
MTTIGIAAVAAAFGRDLDACLERIAVILDHARSGGADLVVLPDAALGGYLTDFRGPDSASLPPALEVGNPWLRKVAGLAGPTVVCVGYCESDGERRYNSAVCLNGDGVLGTHRKVHQPPGEQSFYTAGDRFDAFDTPVGRIGMLIDYDKTFPEAARAAALGGAQILACLSAWPTSITNRAPRMVDDRQSRLFDLYDRSRAAENQLVLVSSNQTGSSGGLRFLGQAKVVGPGGDVLARTWSKAGIALAQVDVAEEIAAARRTLRHLEERRPETYRP